MADNNSDSAQSTTTANADANSNDTNTATLLNQGDDQNTQTNQSNETDGSADGGSLLGTNDQGKDGAGDSANNNNADSGKNDANTNQAITYDLKLPENGVINDASLNAVQEFATKHNLQNDVAQGILDNQNTAIQADQQLQIDEWNNQADAQMALVRADPVLGGDNFAATDMAVTSVLKQFGPEGFMDELKNSRMSENHKVIQFLHNISKAMKQDTLHLGGSTVSGAEKGSAQEIAERMFPVDKL